MMKLHAILTGAKTFRTFVKEAEHHSLIEAFAKAHEKKE